jgi:glutathione reductase (NADPH)
MAAATLPSASAKAAVRNLGRAVSSRQPLLLLLHASSRRGLLPHPLVASAKSQGAHLRRPLSVSASAAATGGNNGAAPRAAEREYDYDLFTIGAGSGGMRASRVASALYGACAAVCEMPFATVASDALGGVGGT